MSATRKKLPCCQFSVWNPGLHGDTTDCGEPASFVWQWGDEEPLYVCEKHDEEVANRQETLTSCRPERT